MNFKNSIYFNRSKVSDEILIFSQNDFTKKEREREEKLNILHFIILCRI
jgi:hypothetical protein